MLGHVKQPPDLKHTLSLTRNALRRKLGSVSRCIGTDDAVAHLVSVAGSADNAAAGRQAACWALGSAMAENGEAVFPLLMQNLAPLLDRSEHEALSPSQIKIFQTPPGQAASTCKVNRLCLHGEMQVTSGSISGCLTTMRPAFSLKQR